MVAGPLLPLSQTLAKVGRQVVKFGRSMAVDPFARVGGKIVQLVFAA